MVSEEVVVVVFGAHGAWCPLLMVPDNLSCASSICIHALASTLYISHIHQQKAAKVLCSQIPINHGIGGI